MTVFLDKMKYLNCPPEYLLQYEQDPVGKQLGSPAITERGPLSQY